MQSNDHRNLENAKNCDLYGVGSLIKFRPGFYPEEKVKVVLLNNMSGLSEAVAIDSLTMMTVVAINVYNEGTGADYLLLSPSHENRVFCQNHY